MWCNIVIFQSLGLEVKSLNDLELEVRRLGLSLEIKGLGPALEVHSLGIDLEFHIHSLGLEVEGQWPWS